MTEAQARGLVAVLMAAYPRQNVEQPTRDLYTNGLMRLGSFNAAAESVDAVIGSSHGWPSLAAIRETYKVKSQRERDAHAQPAIDYVSEGPRELPPEVREFVQKLRVRGMSRNEKLATDLLANLERIGSGECADCKREAELARYGSMELCSRCVAPRIRVAVDLAEAERREKAQA